VELHPSKTSEVCPNEMAKFKPSTADAQGSNIMIGSPGAQTFNGQTAAGSQDTDLLKTSHEVARRTLPFLSQKNIPVTPPNYRLWYAYFSDESKQLREAVDRLLADEVAFTPELSQSLYHRFFSGEATARQLRLADEAGDKIQAMALEVVKNLLVSIAETGEYSQSLNRHIENIEKASDLGDVREIVAAMIGETNQVLKTQDQFQQQMEKTSRDLSRLQDELRKHEDLANTDELTGLPNRRAFNKRLGDEVQKGRRAETPLSLLVFDLDDFKRVNDCFGHLTGDRLLAMTARAITNVVRNDHFAARFGGEEFAVICFTDIKGATLIGERVRRAIERTEYSVRGCSVQTTISGGVAVYRIGEKRDDLLDRADRSLYRAKDLGKNRICTEVDLNEAPDGSDHQP